MANPRSNPRNPRLDELENRRAFVGRHVGPSREDQGAMLKQLGFASLDELTRKTVPPSILRDKPLDLAEGVDEHQMLANLRAIAAKNKVLKSFIGMGYHGTRTPNVILRNVLENPGWYTAYTPYQAEIAQGRLEALLNFQTMVMDLTAMEIANASLLDEGTAAAEAMHMAHGNAKNKSAQTFFVSQECHPQTIEVIETRADPLGVKVVVGDHRTFEPTSDCFATLVQYPATGGRAYDYADFVAKTQKAGAMAIVAADLLSLTLLKPPGEWGADAVVGSAQRFGVPMGFGGPHAGFLATKEKLKRDMPGRLVGVSIDSAGKPALRLALQTREQHIRREKATSNICTAQVLLAVIAGFYAAYHGPDGLKRIAQRTHRLAKTFAQGLKRMGVLVGDEPFFDVVQAIDEPAIIDRAMEASRAAGYNLRRMDARAVCVAFDETSERADVEALWKAFAPPKSAPIAFDEIESAIDVALPSELERTSPYLQQKSFNSHRSETEMLRYLFRLQGKDLSLAHSMIPLGSCTMKLNATAEMIPVTWPEFADMHPFAPLEQAQGYLQMIRELEGWLCELTGFAAVSSQPNAGSQGEYAGLLAIRGYHASRGDAKRDVCLIPSSAHGTNPASAVMAGMKVAVVKCDDQGNVDVDDLRARADEHRDRLSALMITYPSTHGVFEDSIVEICKIVHERGGQVYMDGANFNALVGLCRPGDFGPDVCHLNLHKTFCIPHGGGGPGVGPIGVRQHLRAFLPGHSLVPEKALEGGAGMRTHGGRGAVSSAPWGSAMILPIPWAYIAMMGRDGLKEATQVAILNANYVAKRLEPHYPILYKAKNGMVAHECIIDLRGVKDVTVEDVAKRLIDYGFHAPTMSWPVTGTLMIEPTESESKAELDRFCDAMIAIRGEIARVEKGEWPKDDNPLKRAPHTMQDVAGDEWTRPYGRELAAFPLPWTRDRKFWPTVGRVNNPYGDRNFVCSCAPLESYQEQ